VAANQATAKKAREWIHARGGATAVPSWGKFWLAVLGVYEWHGLNPMPPEMWLLPYALPVHPGRMWCHCRMVYLPMCYIYGIRGTGPQSPLTEALKAELYPQPYAAINWDKARSSCAKEDLYYPHPLIQDAIWWTLMKAEPLLLGSRLRKCVLRACFSRSPPGMLPRVCPSHTLPWLLLFLLQGCAGQGNGAHSL
jgi:cycloartenol synthase